MNTYWTSLPCDLLSSLASFQCSLLHHLHLSSDLGLSKYVNQHSHLNLSRNVRLPVLYDLDFNIWNYTNLLIKKEKSVDQKCNAQYFQDDQWFNLTAHDMRRTLVNAGMKYHRPQIIPGTPLPNSTSPPSPAPI